MAVITEKRRSGAHIAYEVDLALCRKELTVTGGDFVPGTVMGLITASKKATQLAPGASDGSENAHSVLYHEANAASADVLGLVNDQLTRFTGAALTWPDGISQGDMDAAIEALEAKTNRVQ